MAQRGRGRGGRRLNPAFKQSPSARSGVSEAILKQARQSGQLNLSNRSLQTVPSSVWRINVDPPAESSASFGAAGDEQWWDQVDLTKLILAGNVLQELSEEIQHLPALVVLDVHDNKLSSLPAAMGALADLSKLIVSHNNLSTVQPTVTTLTNLKQLKLDHNSLCELPNGMGQLVHVEELDVSHNQLTSLPVSIGEMKVLKTFSASDNQLACIPDSLGQLRELKTLTLHHNKLTEFPSLSTALRLEVLELQYNRLTTIPQILPGPSLVQLHLGFNQLSTVDTDKLSPLTSLVYLDLRDNKINVVPEGIVRLETLERLDLTNNNIAGLPYEMGNMSNLKSLSLEGNTLRGLRRDIVRRGTTEVLKYLRSRIPTDTPPDDPPHHCTKFTPTKQSSSGRVTPPNSKAEGLPSDLGLSPEKKRFDLSNKSLTVFPLEVCEQRQTTELSLGHNKLSSLPPEIGQLTAITVLDLRNNHLSSLPTELASCSRLVDVVLSFNRFSELPSVLYKLPKLENIIANDNQIGSIDVDSLRQIPGLACLDLQNNDIAQVPPQLGTLSTLKHLQLGGNSFRIPRAAVLAKGTQAVLEYLRDRIPA